MFATFVVSIPFPSERNDPLSGFEECEGDYPDTITLFSFCPDPVVIGQPATFHIAGDAPVPIKEGSLLKLTGYLHNKQAFSEVHDFCKDFVDQNSKCPLKGHFDFVTTHPTMANPSDPKNTVVDFQVKISGK